MSLDKKYNTLVKCEYYGNIDAQSLRSHIELVESSTQKERKYCSLGLNCCKKCKYSFTEKEQNDFLKVLPLFYKYYQ
jgi:hypothetical protein